MQILDTDRDWKDTSAGHRTANLSTENQSDAWLEVSERLKLSDSVGGAVHGTRVLHLSVSRAALPTSSQSSALMRAASPLLSILNLSSSCALDPSSGKSFL